LGNPWGISALARGPTRGTMGQGRATGARRPLGAPGTWGGRGRGTKGRTPPAGGVARGRLGRGGRARRRGGTDRVTSSRALEEASRGRDAVRPQGICPLCSRSLAQPPTGRRRVYCSDACRQTAYRSRLALRGGRDGPRSRSEAPIPEDATAVLERWGVLPVADLATLYSRLWPTPDEMAAALATRTVRPAGGRNGTDPGPGWHMRRLRETAEYLMAVRERLSSWVRYYEAGARLRAADVPPHRGRPPAPGADGGGGADPHDALALDASTTASTTGRGARKGEAWAARAPSSPR
jgi:hypothetical protein